MYMSIYLMYMYETHDVAKIGKFFFQFQKIGKFFFQFHYAQT